MIQNNYTLLKISRQKVKIELLTPFQKYVYEKLSLEPRWDRHGRTSMRPYLLDSVITAMMHGGWNTGKKILAAKMLLKIAHIVEKTLNEQFMHVLVVAICNGYTINQVRYIPRGSIRVSCKVYPSPKKAISRVIKIIFQSGKNAYRGGDSCARIATHIIAAYKRQTCQLLSTKRHALKMAAAASR